MWSKIDTRIKSIHLRLVIWFMIILGMTLFAFGAFLYYTLQHSLIVEARDFVSSAAQEDKLIIENKLSSNHLEGLKSNEISDLLHKFESSADFLTLRDTTGHIISKPAYSTKGINVPDFRNVAGVLKGNSEITIKESSGHSRILLCNVPIKQGLKVIGVLEVGQSLEKIDSTVNRLAYFLLFGGSLIFLLAGIGGYWFASFALSPIDNIATAAHRIGKGDFSQRIKVRNRNDEIGQLALTFNKMAGRLESLLKMKTQFVADASHELRTPLTIIQGNVDMLKRWGMDNPQVRSETLAIINREVTRMSNIVSDLLILAQEDAGAPFKREPVELDRILLQIFKKAKILAKNLSVRLKHEDQAVVLGDEERLKQMLLIFVDNAAKYTSSGGEMGLSLYTTNNHAKVVIEDTGIGISDADLPNIYKRFFRVRKSNSGPKEGAGLGLSIAKRIIEAHHGYIKVKSRLGIGTSFSIFLPLEKDSQEK